MPLALFSLSHRVSPLMVTSVDKSFLVPAHSCLGSCRSLASPRRMVPHLPNCTVVA
jgi:hypothetical protein